MAWTLVEINTNLQANFVIYDCDISEFSFIDYYISIHVMLNCILNRAPLLLCIPNMSFQVSFAYIYSFPRQKHYCLIGCCALFME